MYFVSICENRKTKNVEIVLRGGKGRVMEGKSNKDIF
jgi:hypothetical protein